MNTCIGMRKIYKVLNEDVVEIYSCKGHYEDH